MKELFGILLLLVGGTATVGVADEISPSGNTSGIPDQINIQAALDAAGSSKKAEVTLAEGTFYLNGGVGVTGFRGTLKGAGSDKTKVVALGEGSPANRGSVFLFVDGSATVKDLSIEVPDESKYLDSHPGLGVSDGGAAIDIFGGSATIMNVEILSNGPFGPFGNESLETGVLLHNCDGDFDLTSSRFEGVKRSFVFNPQARSKCNLTISGNVFENNRGGTFLLGGESGFLGGNSGAASIRNNTMTDNLINDIFGLLVEYPVTVSGNKISHSSPEGNSAIWFDSGSGPLTITMNETSGRYFLSNIVLTEYLGRTTISGNTVSGASLDRYGAIGIFSSDDVTIKNNDLTGNPYIPGWSVPSLADTGAYALVESTNVRIDKEELPPYSQNTCQVLHDPEIDPSNHVDPDLIECVVAGAFE
jgi:hypothetical protein